MFCRKIQYTLNKITTGRKNDFPPLYIAFQKTRVASEEQEGNRNRSEHAKQCVGAKGQGKPVYVCLERYKRLKKFGVLDK